MPVPQAPAGPVPDTAMPTSEVSRGPTTTTPSPSAPAPDASAAPPGVDAPRVVLDAPTPCPGTPLRVEARAVGAVRRVAFHLLDGPRWRPAAVTEEVAALGEADTDAAGTARLAFTLAPRYAFQGGAGSMLVLQPQGRYRLLASDVATGRRLAETELFLAGPAACAADRFPAAPTLRWDPPAPCGSTPSHLRGAGFDGRVAHLRFEAAYTRFGDGPSIEREVPVAADGTFDFAFVPDEVLTPQGTPLFTERADLEAMAFDVATRRLVRAPLPYCNQELVRALGASSLPLKGGMTGWLTRGGNPPAAPELEAGAFRYESELGAFAMRHGMGAHLDRFRGTDFTRQTALLVVSGPADGATRNEIVAVEHTARGLLVHVVRWAMPVPPLGDLAFDFVEIDRRDDVVSFAPFATGSWRHRGFLAPGLDARGTLEIQEHRAP